MPSPFSCRRGATGLGQTHTIRTKEQNLTAAAQPAGTSSSSRTPSSSRLRPKGPPLTVGEGTPVDDRPPTPLEPSPHEPFFSRSLSGHVMGASEYILGLPGSSLQGQRREHLRQPDPAVEMDMLNQSALESKKELSAAEEK